MRGICIQEKKKTSEVVITSACKTVEDSLLLLMHLTLYMLCMQETSQLKKSLHWIHLAVVPISYVPLHATHATSFTVVDVPGGSALNLLDRKDENASNKHSEILLSPPKH